MLKEEIIKLNVMNKPAYCIKRYDSQGRLILSKLVSINVLEKDDKFYFYDNDCHHIREAEKYLNDSKMYKSKNTRLSIASCLSIVYVFGKIIDKNIFNFSTEDISKLCAFLRGDSTSECHININTKRSRNTINRILNVYANYCEEFEHTQTSEKIRHFQTNIGKRGGANNARNSKLIDCPPFLTKDEIVKCAKYIREEMVRSNIKLRNSIIFQLGLKGCRIGEILGITLEDIGVDIEIVDGKKVYRYYFKTRNRLSDKFYQRSKSSMNVITPSDYLRYAYFKNETGFWKIYIDKELYELLLKYIDEEHLYQSKMHPENYKKTIADAVEGIYKNSNIKNHYVFLNNNGSILSSDSICKYYRKMYEACGISVDKGTKNIGLFHRLRHTYIMFSIFGKDENGNLNEEFTNDVSNAKLSVISRTVRHTSTQSLLKYLSPTKTQIINLKNSFEKDLLDDELRGILKLC